MICFAIVAVKAEIKARICISNCPPTDMVASKINEGTGTNGINEPKKLTNVRPIYPTSDEKNGKKSQISNRIRFHYNYEKISNNH